jgi:hypothetical protein
MFWIGVVMILVILVFITRQLGWGGGNRMDGHPPWQIW